MTMRDDPRRAAVLILNAVDERGSYAEPLLDARLSSGRFADEDRRLVTYLVYGTLRARNRIDWVIRHIYDGDFEAMEDGIRNILRVALCQIMFAGKIPHYAAVDEAVRMTGDLYPGRAGLVNAILRNAIRKRDAIPFPPAQENPVEHISVVHSHPAWLVAMWREELGVDETGALCAANNEIPPLMLRANRLKMERHDVISALAREDVEAHPARFSPDGVLLPAAPGPVRDLASFRRGEVLVQDEASQLISLLAGPEPGEAILDCCAGAGIKTTHMAALMRNRGSIVAVDASAAKIKELAQCAGRLGVSIIEPRIHDITADLGESFCGVFDRILVDVPCTGLGTLRRNPEIKWRIAPGDIDAMAALQGCILGKASRYLKKGGIMIYSTCTVSAKENEGVVENFLRTSAVFRRVRPPASVPREMVDAEGYFRSLPHRHGADGFFGAVLKKEAD